MKFHFALEFNFTKDDFSTKDKLILTYHRIIEAFKFANAYRPHFCDPEFPIHKKEFEEVRRYFSINHYHISAVFLLDLSIAQFFD